MKLPITVLALGVLFFSQTAFAATLPSCDRFTRDLRVGVTSEDVRALQQMLNQDVRTRVSESGLGSIGSESNYFGAKTALAVKKFQEIYKQEILTPLGLTRGSGIFGAASRRQFALHCQEIQKGISTAAPLPTPPLTPITNPTSTLTLLEQITSSTSSAAATSSLPSVPPYLKMLGSYAVHQGDKIVIYGGGYTPSNNTIFVGTESYGGLAPTTKGTLEVTIPANAAKGKFALWFANSMGASRKTFVVITDPSAVAPKITSSTPTTGSIGTTVTITGERFSKEWNDIIVGAETITGLVSPDGTTLTFTATLPVPSKVAAPAHVAFPMWFYVVNPSGVSNNGVFTLSI